MSPDELEDLGVGVYVLEIKATSGSDVYEVFSEFVEVGTDIQTRQDVMNVNVSISEGVSLDIKMSQGVPGINGKDGYTPVKGVDYFDGKDGIGKDGIDGVNGKAPEHEVSEDRSKIRFKHPTGQWGKWITAK